MNKFAEMTKRMGEAGGRLTALLVAVSTIATLPFGAFCAAPGVSYTHYRFKIDRVYGSNAIGTQISELALMCDGENVTRKYMESVERGEFAPKSIADDETQRGTGNWQSLSGEGNPLWAIDGNVTNKFYDCNASFVRSNAEYRDKCYVQINYTNVVRVTSYMWMTGDDSCSLNTGCRSPKNFRLQGSNDGETWTDIDVQENFTPPTSIRTWTRRFVVGGASDMGGYVTDAKWFRWTILRRQNYNWTDQDNPGRMQVSEFDLYDADGNRVNAGISHVEKDKAPTALNPGEVTWSGTMTIGSDVFSGLMDGNLETMFQGRCVLDSTRNIKVVLRLPDNSALVVGYNLATGRNSVTNPSRSPVRWTLEASYDGESWFTLDDRRDVAAPQLNSAWYNAGIPFTFRGPAPNDGVVTVGAFDADAVPGNPIPGRGITVKKVGGGSLDYAGGVPSGVEVADGTLSLMPKFSKFRFKIDALPPTATASYGAQFAEFMLFDGCTNVTYAGFTVASQAVGPIKPETGKPYDSNTASDAVDGRWGTYCYYNCNISPTRSYDPNFDMCYLQLDYSSPRLVTSYAWATAYDSFNPTGSYCRSPYDFRLQGSNDGETWTDLDVRKGFVAPNSSNTMTRAFSCASMQNVAQGTSAKLFRLTIKSTKVNAAATKGTQIGEFGLFDANGARVNTNLVVTAQRKAASALAAGEATASASKNVNTDTKEGLVRLFDGYCDTKFYYNYVDHEFDVNESSTWLVVTMRLWDDAPDVYSYGFATANDTANRDPNAWLLEASTDGGTTWTKLDERSGYNMTTKRQVWDTYCMPFAELARSEEWNVSNVCVAAGATLNVGDARVTIGGLTVDCAAGGGTIDRFNAAETGVINLVNSRGLSASGYALPISFGEIANAANLANWSVRANGRERQCRVTCEDGSVTIYGPGLMVIVE